MADVIDGAEVLRNPTGAAPGQLLEQDGRMSERVARDQDAQTDPGRARGERRQQRPRFVDRDARRAVRVDQVVHQPGVVEAEVLGHLELVVDLAQVRYFGATRSAPCCPDIY